MARYHLDHAAHGHEDEEHALPAEPAVVEAISGEPPAAVVEEAAADEEARMVYVPLP